MEYEEAKLFWTKWLQLLIHCPLSLQVVFADEPGEDEGGVQKEFFMLLLQEILNPDFGMFTEDEESHFVWFREQVCSRRGCVMVYGC